MAVKWKIVCEVLVLTLICVFIGVLFTLPTVFFFVIASEPFDGSATDTNTSDVCSRVFPYTGEVCRAELMSIQACVSGGPYPLDIPATIDQEEAETSIGELLDQISLHMPSPDCEERLKPFLCLHTFGLCDSTGNFYTALRETCEELREDCRRDFLSEFLPVCENLQNMTDECNKDCLNCIQLNDTTTSDICQNQSNTSIIDEPFCTEGAYFDENGTEICRPVCGQFLRRDIAVRQLAFALGFVCSILVIVLAVTTQRDTLYVCSFPSVLLICMKITSFFLLFFIIVGFFDNTGLFCASKDLLHSISAENVTAFCTITGVVFSYGLLQMTLWASVHSAVLFIATAFPFTFRKLQVTEKTRYISISVITLGVLVPLPLSLAFLADGFVPYSFPVLVCFGRNIDLAFYTVVLPLSIELAVTLIMVILTFWTLVKSMIRSKSKMLSVLCKAELKVVTILVYYSLVGIVSLSMFDSLGMTRQRVDQQDLSTSYLCAASRSCYSSMPDLLLPADTRPLLLSEILLFMISCYPIVTLVFTVNFTACMKRLKLKRVGHPTKPVSRVTSKSGVVLDSCENGASVDLNK